MSYSISARIAFHAIAAVLRDRDREDKADSIVHLAASTCGELDADVVGLLTAWAYGHLTSFEDLKELVVGLRHPKANYIEAAARTEIDKVCRLLMETD